MFFEVLVVVAAYLQQEAILDFPYLHHLLLKGHSYEAVLSSAQIALVLFQVLGLQLNVTKSTLTPVKKIEFIGASLDTLTDGNYLLIDRFITLSDL